MTVMQSGVLEDLGFEEIEPGCVEDTQPNRKRIRLLDGDWQYEPVLDEDGIPNGLLRVFTPEQVTARRLSVHDRRKPILVDPDNAWSDYVEPDDYPMDVDVPFFIKERLARWKRQEREGIPPEERDPFPIRCTTIRHDETRCWNWAANPQKVDRCKAHLGWVEQSQLKAAAYAKQRVVESTPLAVDRLAFLMEHGETHAVQLKASTEILDRGGVKAGYDIEQHVEIEVVDPAAEVQRRLEKLARARIESERRAAAAALELEQDTVEGEVVHDDERRALPSGE